MSVPVAAEIAVTYWPYDHVRLSFSNRIAAVRACVFLDGVHAVDVTDLVPRKLEIVIGGLGEQIPYVTQCAWVLPWTGGTLPAASFAHTLSFRSIWARRAPPRSISATPAALRGNAKPSSAPRQQESTAPGPAGPERTRAWGAQSSEDGMASLTKTRADTGSPSARSAASAFAPCNGVPSRAISSSPSVTDTSRIASPGPRRVAVGGQRLQRDCSWPYHRRAEHPLMPGRLEVVTDAPHRPNDHRPSSILLEFEPQAPDVHRDR